MYRLQTARRLQSIFIPVASAAKRVRLFLQAAIRSGTALLITVRITMRLVPKTVLKPQLATVAPQRVRLPTRAANCRIRSINKKQPRNILQRLQTARRLQLIITLAVCAAKRVRPLLQAAIRSGTALLITVRITMRLVPKTVLKPQLATVAPQRVRLPTRAANCRIRSINKKQRVIILQRRQLARKPQLIITPAVCAAKRVRPLLQAAIRSSIHTAR